jgi:hypothetical protein
VAEHHLEDVACGDVVLGGGDQFDEAGLVHRRGEVGGGDFDGLRRRGQGRAKVALESVQTLDRALVSGLGVQAVVGIGGGDQNDLVLHRIEDGDDGRTGQDGVGQVQRIGIGLAQRLQQADHVIAEDAEQPCGHGRQARRQVEARGRHQGAQGTQDVV